MLALLNNLVTYTELHKDHTCLAMVTHGRFKEDFGYWRKDQSYELLQVVVYDGKVWLEEFCAALCVRRVQICLGVVP